MILRYCYLSRHPRVFLTMTALPVNVFDELVRDMLPVRECVIDIGAQLDRHATSRSSRCWTPFG